MIYKEPKNFNLIWVKSLIKTDTDVIDKKHTGKFISNITYDVSQITNLLSQAILISFLGRFSTIFENKLFLFSLILKFPI